MQAPPDGIDVTGQQVLSNTISSMDSSYHVGGNLYLPNPETCQMNEGKLALARELQPWLKQLDARDLSRKSRN
jgi:hypothetical protein